MPDITKAAYKKIKKLESIYPFSEDSIEIYFGKLFITTGHFLLLQDKQFRFHYCYASKQRN